MFDTIALGSQSRSFWTSSSSVWISCVFVNVCVCGERRVCERVGRWGDGMGLGVEESGERLCMGKTQRKKVCLPAWHVVREAVLDLLTSLD